MNKRQRQAWDALASKSSETVLRILTAWHGVQLFSDDFLEYLADKGYVVRDNCESGTYDCSSCPLNGKCARQVAMEVAVNADSFDDFCDQFQKCRGCPMAKMEYHPCKEEHWLEWRAERLQ